MMVVVPENEAADLPDESAFLTQASSMRERDLAPREDDAGIEGDLMVAPDPVEEVSTDNLTDDGATGFIDPLLLTFDNGVTVSLNVTNIVDGQVEFEARSPGGLAVLDDADIAAANAVGAVVGQSGIATYDRVELEAFLADRDVALQSSVDTFTEGLFGSASTTDLEVLFQLIHLGMTQPRVDAIALEQYLDDEMPYAADPSIDPDHAGFVTLLNARYDDPRYLLPTVDSLNSVTVEDVERVVRDRFGDASDFSFAFSGDFDVDEMIELSRRYLGTLPSTGRVESVDYVEPSPPPGIVAEQTNAGEGEQAEVIFLFTAPATPDRRDDVAAQIVQEIVTARLTDTVREELGDSYSPYAMVQLTSGATPNAESFMSNTTGVDLVDEVVAAVLEQLEDLRSSGPTEAEFAAATEVVRQELDLFSNGQINDEVLAVLTDPAGNPSFDEFLGQAALVDDIDIAAIRNDIVRWFPVDQYIEVRVAARVRSETVSPMLTAIRRLTYCSPHADQGRSPEGDQPGVERRGDRTRSAQGRRGAGEDRRLRHVPQRRAPASPATSRAPPRRCRSSAATRAPASCWRSARRLGLGPAITSCSASSRPAAVARAAPTGTRNLCDMGDVTATGMQLSDGTAAPPQRRRRRPRSGIGALGTFAHHTVVNEASCIKIDKDLPLDRACLLGCGVVTGWGSAVYAAEVARATSWPSSVSAASAPTPCRAPSSPALASSPPSTRSSSSARRRWSSAPRTPTRPSPTRWRHWARSTWGRGFDKVIMTMGVGNGDVLGEAFWLGGKRSKIVVTNIHPVRGLDRHPGACS